MKQLYLFDAPQTFQESMPKQLLDVNYWKLFIDGASRNNPGPAGVGIAIMKNDTVYAQYGYHVGTKTNNQAEYLALVMGIYYIKQVIQQEDLLLITSDSQLLVRHMTGHYKVKHPDLKPLYACAKHMLVGINHDIVHVLREENTQADALANKGIDEKIRVPHDLVTWLKQHEISL